VGQSTEAKSGPSSISVPTEPRHKVGKAANGKQCEFDRGRECAAGSTFPTRLQYGTVGSLLRGRARLHASESMESGRAGSTVLGAPGQRRAHAPGVSYRGARFLGAFREGRGGCSLCFICADALAVYREARLRGIGASEPQVGNGMWVTGLADPDGFRLYFESPTDTPEDTRLSEVES